MYSTKSQFHKDLAYFLRSFFATFANKFKRLNKEMVTCLILLLEEMASKFWSDPATQERSKKSCFVLHARMNKLWNSTPNCKSVVIFQFNWTFGTKIQPNIIPSINSYY